MYLSACGDDVAGETEQSPAGTTDAGTSSTGGSGTEGETCATTGDACLTCDMLSDSVCDAYLDDDGGCPSHATALQPLWDGYCVAACHQSDGPLIFSLEGQAYGRLVNACAVEPSGDCAMNRVTPFSPTQSYLWYKLKGHQGCVPGIGGERMPPDSPPLLDPLMETVERWICCGAPE